MVKMGEKSPSKVKNNENKAYETLGNKSGTG